MKKIKIGQIGIGHNHSNKLISIKKHPELFELIGYSEQNEDWVARRGSNAVFGDVPRLTEEEIIAKSDAILVETDVWDLTATAQKCIDAGKHIHMDKPASGTLNEYRRLLDTAKAKELVVQLGYMYRYNPNVEKVLQMAQSGELGAITSIQAEMSTCHSDTYRNWLNNFQGGSMYIFGSHLIDLIVYLLGKPEIVTSHLGSSEKNGIHSTDLCAATLGYPQAIARVFVSSVEVNGWGRRVFSVAGTEGTVELRPIEAPVRMTLATPNDGPAYHADIAKEIPTVEVPNADRYEEMLLAFYDYIVGAKQNPFTYEHDLAVQEVLDEIVGGVKSLGKNIN